MSSPIIIAGPILRRVENNKVAIWLALSIPRHVKLQIWEGDGIKQDGDSELFNPPSGAIELPLKNQEGPAVQFGQSLYIALINAEVVSPGLNQTKAYSYKYSDTGSRRSG